MQLDWRLHFRISAQKADKTLPWQKYFMLNLTLRSTFPHIEPNVIKEYQTFTFRMLSYAMGKVRFGISILKNVKRGTINVE